MLKIILALALATVVQTRTCLAQQREQVVYAAEFKPPALYRQWYAEAERCVGKRGNYSKLVFAHTPAPWNQHVNSDTPGKVSQTYGMWHNIEGSRDSLALIVLTDLDWDNPWYVKHEMIHDILWRNGWRSPPGSADLPDSTNIRNAHPVPPYQKCAPTYIDEIREKWIQQKLAESPFKATYRP